MRRIRILALCLGLTSSCTWVELSPRGESVRVATLEQVADCERRGRTTSTTAHRVGAIPRDAEKMGEELTALARNEAPGMGADTVVPESEVDEGRQVFGLYRCGGQVSK